MAESAVRIAAVGDLHCTKSSHGAIQAAFARLAGAADLLLLAGDITNAGLPDEARVLVKELAALPMPIAAVLGNHDLRVGQSRRASGRSLGDAGIDAFSTRQHARRFTASVSRA